MLQPAVSELIRKEWSDAPRGTKTEIVRKWSALTGISYSRLYAQLNTGRKRRKGDNRIEDIQEQAMIIASIKKRPPEHRGEICTEDAIAIALSSGHNITASKSSLDRHMRESGTTQTQRRIVRYQADYPNHLHHVDASSSDCFYAARQVGEDYILKLYKGYKGYKNKPIPIGKRPWVYGLVDDFSGCLAARYTVADGESAADNLLFLLWAWGEQEGKDFFGIPDFLKGDHGPMMKSAEATYFFDRLGVAIDPSIPGNKEAHGKIERTWRTQWQRFELPFWSEDPASFEISLSDLNRRFLVYQRGYNRKKHRFRKTQSRLGMWQTINSRGGASALPENAMRHIVTRHERTVDAAGCFSIDNQIYEVKGLHSAKVWVYAGLYDAAVSVENRETGKRYEAKPFRPLGFDEFKAQPDTPHQKAKKAAEDMELTNTLHTEETQKQLPEGVIAFPVQAKVKEVREIPDLTDMSRYSSTDEAVAAFVELSGIVPEPEFIGRVRELFLENALSVDYVACLAAEVAAAYEQTAEM